jgi:anthranilate/para-aminobenzoate synthase component I
MKSTAVLLDFSIFVKLKMQQMKKITTSFWVVALVSLLAVACNKEQQTNNSAGNELSMQAELDQMEEKAMQDLIEVQLAEANETEMPELKNDGISCKFNSDPMELKNETMGAMDRTACVPCNCNHVLREMNLSDEQVQHLRRSWAEFQKCSSTAKRRLAAAHQRVMEEYRTAVKNAHMAFRKGDIDRAQLKQRIERINTKFRELIRNADGREQLCKEIAKCHREYLARVQRVLNERQWKLYRACMERC